MSNLLILGAGQYGSLVYDIAKETQKFDKIDFLDDISVKAIGKTNEMAKFIGTYKFAIVAIGNSGKRIEFLKALETAGFEIPVLCSPKAYIAPSAQVSSGTIIEPMAVVHSNSKVGKGCLVCAGAVINHDAVVEDGCQIDCNAVVPSSQTVPKSTMLPCGYVFPSNK